MSGFAVIGAVALALTVTPTQPMAHTAPLAGRCPVAGYMLEMPRGFGDWQLREWAIRDAVALFSGATGQLWRFDGYTDWTPTAENVDAAPDDLVIDIDDPADTDVLTVDPGHEGYTITTASHAVIALSVGRVAAMPIGLDLAAGRSVLELTEHELGHVAGLPHTYSPGDVMNPDLSGGPFYTPVERAALAASPCRA